MHEILFGLNSTGRLKKGIDKLANTIRITAGPRGRNVVIDKGHGASDVTNDGATVARSITPSDPVENMGAHMVKEVASDTEEIAGDGTTTASILFQAMVAGGIESASLGGNVMDIKRGMDKAAKQLAVHLSDAAIPVADDPRSLIKVATISANNDEFLGGLIAEAFHEVGNDGVISVEDSNTIDTDLVIVDGMRIDRGWMSPYFMTDQRTGDAVLENPYIVVTDTKIVSATELNRVVEMAPEGYPILLIADDIDPTALASIILHHTQKKLNLTCVKTPGFGDSKIDLAGDLCASIGAEYVCTGKGGKLSAFTKDMFGRASKVIVGRDSTTVIGGQGDEALVEERVINVKSLLSMDQDDYAKGVLGKRLGSLTNGVAVIRVGAASETEIKEKKYRLDDALAATRSAISEGIVPGGGVALLNAVNKFDDEAIMNSDERIGAQIVLTAAVQPFSAIVENAGFPSGYKPTLLGAIKQLFGGPLPSSVLTPGDVMRKLEGQDENYGLNIKTGEYGDLIEQGVVDPVKVTKTALLNAASVASMLLTTKAVVYETPELD